MFLHAVHSSSKFRKETEESKAMKTYLEQILPQQNLLTVFEIFFAYSIIGWFVESAYMSLCNRQFTNRGFVRGPLCPIYGVGEFIIYNALSPLANNYIALFFVGTMFATSLEYLTARIMIRKFGFVWWDYTNKPFNYKGIICLESTIAWGAYTIFEFAFLHRFVVRFIQKIPAGILFFIVVFLMLYLMLDMIHCCRKIANGEIEERTNNLMVYKEK